MRLVLVTVSLVCASLAYGEFSPDEARALMTDNCLNPEGQECFDILQPIKITCASSNATGDPVEAYSWLVNGRALNTSSLPGNWTLTDGGSTLLVEGARVEHPTTECTCLVDGVQKHKYELHPMVLMYLPMHSDAVQGKTLIITCIVHSNLLSPVTWWFRNNKGKLLRVEQAMGARAVMREAGGVHAAQLQLKDVQPSDEGQYICRMGTHSAHTYVSVYTDEIYRLFHPYD